MNHTTLPVQTRSHSELHDITRAVAEIVRNSNVQEGRCSVYVPHTTCGVTINENADPSVKQDILMELDKRIPWNDNYSHSEGNSAAHLKASLMGFSVSIPISSGRMMLGTWQGIYLCEFDGPRSRRVIISIE
ncbi:MAG: secondary thiamine-phosphate synthase enzyme YjbQ [Spirochaetota bacterium]|nr:secondary thiamine-phosphate synthase enzyme YjbQ [Spirochaetota bacterium]